MTDAIRISQNGCTTTLTVCSEHIDDVSASLTALHGMLNAFAEQYADVPPEVFVRRAAVSQGQFARMLNTAMETLYDASQLLKTTRALAVGAALLSAEPTEHEEDE